MKNSVLLRQGLLFCLVVMVFAAGVVIGQKANKFGTPASVIHVVTLKWKDDSTPAQRQKALDGVREMAATIPGIRNVWLKTLKVQGRTPDDKPYDTAFVMEFENEAAFKAYADHPKHTEWSKQIYEPIRHESRSHDITNDAPMKK